MEKDILPAQRTAYPGDLLLDAEQLSNTDPQKRPIMWYLALGYERIFLEPAIKFIRRRRGMIPHGVY